MTKEEGQDPLINSDALYGLLSAVWLEVRDYGVVLILIALAAGLVGWVVGS